MKHELCTRCDGDGFNADYVTACQRCDGTGREPHRRMWPGVRPTDNAAKDLTARAIAHAITMNCDDYHAGKQSRDDWDATQNALWAEAARQLIASRVMGIVCPSLGGAR